MGKQGETATNKDNNINIIKGLIYSGIPSNMTGYCKLMAQNWHKSFALVRACIGFFLRSMPLLFQILLHSPNQRRYKLFKV